MIVKIADFNFSELPGEPDPHGEKGDLFALAIILYEILTKRIASFHGLKSNAIDIQDKLEKDKKYSRIEKIKNPVLQGIVQLLSPDPELRPSAKQIAEIFVNHLQ